MNVPASEEPSGDHLHPAVREMLSWPVERRIAYVREDKWIGYAEARAALKALSDLLVQPDKLRHRGVLVSAKPDNGKSAVLKRFEHLNKPITLDSGEPSKPVVRVWTPDEPSETKLWSQVLKALKTPHRSSDPARILKEQAVRQIDFLQVRLLMFDELHNLLRGSVKRTEHLLTLLKMLVNEMPLRIAVAGTQEIVRAVVLDKQLKTRFDCYQLPPWRDDIRLRTFLKGLESTFPLPEPSNLHEQELRLLMLSKADQTIGGFVVQVQRAAELAVSRNKPCIDAALVREAQRNAGTDLDGLAKDL